MTFDRCKTFESWRVPFMDVKQLAAAGFFFTNWGDVRCAFCGVEVEHLVEGDYEFKDHQRWNPPCKIVKEFVGNIPAPAETSQQPSSSYDVCGPYMEYTPKRRVQSVVCIYLLLFIYFLLCIILAVH